MPHGDYQKDSSGKELALEARATEEDRLKSPSAERNKDVIRDTFLSAMPQQATVLEVGSGTGQHACHICHSNKDMLWHPSDPDEASRRSIAAWTAHLELQNVLPPLQIDVTASQWFMDQKIPAQIDIIISLNMIHIAPFAAAEGLFAGAAQLLSRDGHVFLYGPFKRKGETAPSNMSFDQSLKSRDPAWGVRDLDTEIMPLADKAGLEIKHIMQMPANNLSVIFKKK